MAVAVEQETERLEKRGSSGREEGEMGRRGAGLEALEGEDGARGRTPSSGTTGWMRELEDDELLTSGLSEAEARGRWGYGLDPFRIE